MQLMVKGGSSFLCGYLWRPHLGLGGGAFQWAGGPPEGSRMKGIPGKSMTCAPRAKGTS